MSPPRKKLNKYCTAQFTGKNDFDSIVVTLYLHEKNKKKKQKKFASTIVRLDGMGWDGMGTKTGQDVASV